MALSYEPDLPCGRSSDALWDRLYSAPDPHERGCEHCQEARRSLKTIDAAAKELRAQEETTETSPSPVVKDRIMAAARADFRRRRSLEVLERPGTSITASEQALIRVVRSAADAVPGVVSRRCRIRTAEPDGSGRRPLEIDLSLAVTADASIQETSTMVRNTIAAALDGVVGVSATRIDVRVEDLHDS